MPNSLLTIQMITREAVRLWKNTNAFLQNIDTQYDDTFARSGAKIGTQLRIRLPNDYTVRTGAAASAQDTTEQSLNLVVATQKGIDVAFSSVERTMSLDDYSRRILAPQVNNLAGNIAADIMSGSEGGVSNYVSNVDGGSAVISPGSETWLTAGAILDSNSARTDMRMIVTDPFTDARTVSTLSGLFNPSPRVAEQYQTGAMRNALGFDWMRDQTVIRHVNGTFTAGTVNGANQTGSSLVTNAITGTLTRGDIITIANVNAVNRITKQTTGPRQFVVTANAASGATVLQIYPSIVPAIGGAAVQYQTVDASPANAAPITMAGLPSEVTRRNIAFVPDMVTMATADLELPRGVHEAAREQYDGLSMRMITGYNISTDQFLTRMDILYGYLYVRPEWGVIVADKI